MTGTGCSRSSHENVLILVHGGDPLSREIGEAYATSQGIASSRILSLPLPASRAEGEKRATEIDWETFRDRIETPLEAYLEREDPDGEIEILVTTRGLPLRVGRCDSKERDAYARSCRAAALDAALAVLGRIDFASAGLGNHPNPYFGDSRTFSEFRRDSPDSELRFLVARITGPAEPTEPAAAGLASQQAVPPILRWVHDLAQREAGFEETDRTAPDWRSVEPPDALVRSAAAATLLAPIGNRRPDAGDDPCEDCERMGANPNLVGVVYADLEGADLGGAATGNAGVQTASRHIAEGGAPPGESLRRVAEHAVELAGGGFVVDLMPRNARASAHATADSGPEASGAASTAWSASFDRAIANWLAAGALAISTHLDDPTLAGVTHPAVALEAFVSGRPAVEAHFKSLPQLGWMNLFVGEPLLTVAAPRIDDEGDRDGDGVDDDEDNCRDHANPLQRDTDGDGFGNRCDPDVDDDGLVNTSWGRIYPVDARGDLETIALTVRSGPYNPDHDLDGDGVVDAQDLALAQLWLFRAPGPSGRVAAPSTTPD
jgi:hypothetical protein